MFVGLCVVFKKNKMPKPAVDYLNSGSASSGAISDTLRSTVSSAIDVPHTILSVDMPLPQLVGLFAAYAFIIAALLCGVFIFIGGMSFILSGGDDAKVKQAVNTIRYAIVGLIITIFSVFIVVIVGRPFGLNLIDYISYDQIIGNIKNIFEMPTSSGGGSQGSTSSGGFQIIR